MELTNIEIEKLPVIDRYIATTAIHKLGTLSRKDGDLCRVTKESDTDYYGMWVTGMGFFNVRFPKETTRELTKEEIEKWNSTYIQLSDYPPYKLNVNKG